MVAVIVTLLSTAAGAIWSAATLDNRVSQLEAQIPPGALQRLDERTLQIQQALQRLESSPGR
jgi:hypothetical protein